MPGLAIDRSGEYVAGMAWRTRLLTAALLLQWGVWVAPVHLLMTGAEPAAAEPASHCASAPTPGEAPEPTRDPACDLHCSVLDTAMVAPVTSGLSAPSFTTLALRIAPDPIRASARATRGTHTAPPGADPALRTTVLRL
jgi:hypothetical protein